MAPLYARYSFSLCTLLPPLSPHRPPPVPPATFLSRRALAFTLNLLQGPSVTGIEINKQAFGAISRSVNICLTVSRLGYISPPPPPIQPEPPFVLLVILFHHRSPSTSTLLCRPRSLPPSRGLSFNPPAFHRATPPDTRRAPRPPRRPPSVEREKSKRQCKRAVYIYLFALATQIFRGLAGYER